MRRFLLGIVLFTLGAVAPLVPACSSGNNGSAPATDSSIAPGALLGRACDPTVPKACLPGPPCFLIRCDPSQLVCVESRIPGCVQNGVDAAGLLTPEGGSFSDVFVSSGCFNDSQCKLADGGGSDRCGYGFNQGCSATGTCVTPEVPLTDAGTPYVACGCNGQPVPYVTQTMTSAPVSSPTPCVVDGGPIDASAVDAGADAPSEGGGD